MPIGIVSDDEFRRELNNSGTRSARLPPNEPNEPTSQGDGSHTEDVVPSVPQVVPSNQSVPSIEVMARRGRDEGDVNVPDSLRKLIAEEALLNGRPAALKLATQFGISPASVAAYSNGATSTASYDTPSKSLIGHINKSRERAIKRASKTLNGALAAITQEKLDYCDPTDLSGIAKDMSVIIKNLEPKQTGEGPAQQGPQFVIFAPSFRQENSFETIEVKE